jgi:diaminopimelate decarboxylase
LGRFLVEDTAVAVATVERVKRLGDLRWLVVDLSTNLLVPLPLARFELAERQGRELVRTAVCDGTCSPAGVFCRDIMYASVPEGERIAILNCGAYTAALAEPFFEPPAPVFWCDGEEVTAIVGPADAAIATDLLQGGGRTICAAAAGKKG